MGNLVAPRAPRAWNRCWSPWHQCPDAHHASSPAVPISSSARAGASTGGARSVADSVAATVGNYRGARPRTTWPPVSGPTGELAPRAAHPPVHQRRPHLSASVVPSCPAPHLSRSALQYAGPVSDPITASIETVGTTLDAVERALTRLREGTYRTCSTCAAPLDPEALGADPLLEHCSAHAEPR